ncbi:MAG TPA: hypothetical protein VGH03_08105, partial [Caulobacteraceae bacterium]
AAWIALGLAPGAWAQADSVVRLVRVEPLPKVGKGDFDQFAVDLKRGRLFLSAEASGQIEVFDLKSGVLIRSGGDIRTPHRLAVDETTGRLFAADGGDASVKVFDETLRLIKRIPVGADPDGGVYDASRRIFYVGARTDGSPDAPSSIAAISTATMAVEGSTPIPAHTLKDMIIDRPTGRLYVSMRDKNEVGVVPLAGGALRTFSASGMNQNVPLALDARRRLLFVGARKPGKLFVLDADDGRTLAAFDCTDVSDSMAYDARSQRLLVTGVDGLSVFNVHGTAQVTPVGLDAQVEGKSSLYVPSLHRLYVARPRSDTQAAALEVYEIR